MSAALLALVGLWFPDAQAGAFTPLDLARKQAMILAGIYALDSSGERPFFKERDAPATHGEVYDQAFTQGVEIEVRSRFANGTGGYMSYAYTRTGDGQGDPLTNNSENVIKMGVYAPLLPRERLYVSLESQWHEEHLTLAGERVPDAFLANLSFYYPAPFQKLRLTATICNLFNEDLQELGSAEHPEDPIIPEGRTLSLVASYHF